MIGTSLANRAKNQAVFRYADSFGISTLDLKLLITIPISFIKKKNTFECKYDELEFSATTVESSYRYDGDESDDE